MSDWDDDPSIGATGRSYTIRSVGDFLSVPVERRRICLREFHAWLTCISEMPKMFQDIADAMGKPLDEVVCCRSDAFVWDDDGKGEALIRLEPMDGEPFDSKE